MIDESVLHRFAGPDEILADQLDHLVALARRPTVELRIMPIRSPAFAAADFPFVLFYGTGAEVPFLTLVEDRSRAHYGDTIDAIDTHLRLFEYLWRHAMSNRASIELLRATKGDLK